MDSLQKASLKTRLLIIGITYATVLYFSNVAIWSLAGYPLGELPTTDELTGGLVVLWFAAGVLRFALYPVIGFLLVRRDEGDYAVKDAFVLGVVIALINRLLHTILMAESLFETARVSGLSLQVVFGLSIAGALAYVVFTGALAFVGGWIAR